MRATGGRHPRRAVDDRADRERPVMRRERFPRFWAAIAVLAFAAVVIESANAHDKGCDANPVPKAIKLDCCGKADEHQLKPEQITRGPNDEYIVSFEGYTFVIPADKALPSNDPCSQIFFENVWAIAGGNVMPVFIIVLTATVLTFGMLRIYN
jgi:hypothetical protein